MLNIIGKYIAFLLLIYYNYVHRLNAKKKENMTMKNEKISLRLWFNIILFGMMGQIAWNIENMYFNTFLYNNIYSNGATQAAVDSSIPYTSAISLMVGLSAATAVITTFVMGTLSDRLNKRKVFISVGYIIWGLITASFGLISREHIASLFHLSDEVQILTATVWTVIVMDCVMTFMGSTSNDSAFNAWVTDVTTPKNRPLVETVFAALPLIAMGLVVVLGSLAQAGTITYALFFGVLGIVVAVCGVIGLFSLEEPKTLVREKGNSNYWSDLFYGFRPSVIKENARFYIILVASCIISIASQVYFPYLLIYIQYVVLPKAGENLLTAPNIICAIISVAIMAAGIIGLLVTSKKKSRGALLLVAVSSSIFGLFLLGFSKSIPMLILSAAPTVVGYAMQGILLNATVRDFTPQGKAGQFQGIRMIFGVLIPMVLGPVTGALAIERSAVTYLDEYGTSQTVPTELMFTFAAVISLVALIPLAFLVKKGFLNRPNDEEESEPTFETA